MCSSVLGVFIKSIRHAKTDIYDLHCKSWVFFVNNAIFPDGDMWLWRLVSHLFTCILILLICHYTSFFCANYIKILRLKKKEKMKKWSSSCVTQVCDPG